MHHCPASTTARPARSTQHLVALLAATAAGAALAFTPLPAAQAGGATCFGETPTITGSGYVRGTSGDDVILAGPGSEVHALAGDDRVCGSGLVYAGPGADRVFSRTEGPVELNGGPGKDRLFYLGSDLAHLDGGRGGDHLRSGVGQQYAVGGAGDDDIALGKGADHANGKAGRDRIDGGPGADAAHGGRGRDTCTRVEEATGCER